MAEAISFPSTTANVALPLLFSGQAQKEFFLNQALVTLDAMIAGSVLETRDAPPVTAQEGQCFLVASNASDEWQGHDDQIAARVGEAWHFISPSNGMEIYDQALGQKRFYKTHWEVAADSEEPTGGAVVDTEARTSIGEILNALRNLGILPDST